MGIELLLFVISAFYTYKFLKKWYQALSAMWPPKQISVVKNTLKYLPLVSLAIYLFTLTVLASFDVVDSFIYITLYTTLGYAWLNLGLVLMAYFFDMSWVDDAINNNNKAALFSVTGGFVGLSLIYAGANIGDGPGWWCVVFAGGLGLIAWIIMALIINLFTKIFERITVERDISCGIRIGTYLLASGIILGRASSGDWTSFGATVVEFMVGWPVLPLSLLTIIVEYFYIKKSKSWEYKNSDNIKSSIFWGIAYVATAIASVILV